MARPWVSSDPPAILKVVTKEGVWSDMSDAPIIAKIWVQENSLAAKAAGGSENLELETACLAAELESQLSSTMGNFLDGCGEHFINSSMYEAAQSAMDDTAFEFQDLPEAQRVDIIKIGIDALLAECPIALNTYDTVIDEIGAGWYEVVASTPESVESNTVNAIFDLLDGHETLRRAIGLGQCLHTPVSVVDAMLDALADPSVDASELRRLTAAALPAFLPITTDNILKGKRL